MKAASLEGLPSRESALTLPKSSTASSSELLSKERQRRYIAVTLSSRGATLPPFDFSQRSEGLVSVALAHSITSPTTAEAVGYLPAPLP